MSVLSGCTGAGATSSFDGGLQLDSASLSADADTAADAAEARDSSVAPRDSAVPTGDSGTPAGAGPRWVGRVDLRDLTLARMQWSGTGFIARFRGTALYATIDHPMGYFTVVVDGVVQARLVTGSSTSEVTIASGLSDAEHTVELYRRIEPSQGTTEISGIRVDGEMLAVPPPTRVIEVVGDSITCGYGNEGADQFCSFSPDTENHFLTYAAITARALGAELSTVAWSGKGIYYNYGDDSSAHVEPLPEIYGLTLPVESDTTQATGPLADAVVINLGTNDYSTDVDPTRDEFVTSYLDLIAQVRTRHPSAMIFCTVAPLLSGSDLATAQSAIDDVVAMRHSMGDTAVKRIDLTVPDLTFGCDWHPSIAAHMTMATQLTSELRSELGW
jgi:lysophospholipase L1-like esterase